MNVGAANAAAETIGFVGLPFANLSMRQAIEATQAASRGDSWSYVVTPNAANFARLGNISSPLRRLYEGAHLRFLDSRVIWLICRVLHRHPPLVVPGADLVEQLFLQAIGPETPVCIVGGGPAASAEVSKRFALRRLHHCNPPMGFWRSPDEIAKVVAFVAESRADYTFLVVGSPGQEILAAEIAGCAGARGVGICAGASIDFITGRQRRAPQIMRSLALEWAYRLCREPRRLAYRYCVESPKGILLALRPARDFQQRDAA